MTTPVYDSLRFGDNYVIDVSLSDGKASVGVAFDGEESAASRDIILKMRDILKAAMDNRHFTTALEEQTLLPYASFQVSYPNGRSFERIEDLRAVVLTVVDDIRNNLAVAAIPEGRYLSEDDAAWQIMNIFGLQALDRNGQAAEPSQTVMPAELPGGNLAEILREMIGDKTPSNPGKI